MNIKSLSTRLNTDALSTGAKRKPIIIALAALVVIGGGTLIFSGSNTEKKAPTTQPSLSVTIEHPQTLPLLQKFSANGNIAAWQEAVIGNNVSGLVLADVRVNVGDVVKRGQVLATFANQSVVADLEQTKAHIAEAEASALEAESNAERARKVGESGALSAQQLTQYSTAAQTARAKLNAQIAAAKVQQIRLADTQIIAPDDGIISARTATVGSVPATQELFRMIRQSRLEWRAEVSALQLPLLKPGLDVTVTPANGPSIKGKIRIIAPTVDLNTRNGIAYVDLPAPGTAKAGMFAAGEFELGSSDALTLPQTAVTVKDGFSYVFIVGANNQVTLTKIATGRRSGDRIEVTSGLDKNAQVVASGGGFLTDGDTVRVVAKTENASTTNNVNNSIATPAAVAEKH